MATLKRLARRVSIGDVAEGARLRRRPEASEDGAATLGHDMASDLPRRCRRGRRCKLLRWCFRGAGNVEGLVEASPKGRARRRWMLTEVRLGELRRWGCFGFAPRQEGAPKEAWRCFGF